MGVSRWRDRTGCSWRAGEELSGTYRRGDDVGQERLGRELVAVPGEESAHDECVGGLLDREEKKRRRKKKKNYRRP